MPPGRDHLRIPRQPLSGREAEQYRTAAYLLVVGIVLYAINYLFTRGRAGGVERTR
ncbi:MAG: hypothetical protein ACRDPW_03985 [Mycobacteriales bacterium]